MKPCVYVAHKRETDFCLKIYYRDFEISATTITTVPEILIYDNSINKDVTEQVTGNRDYYFDLESLAEIKNKIDQYLDN